MEFDDRLEKAIQRGQRRSEEVARGEAQKAMNEKDLARLHARLRNDLSDRIETILRSLGERFPGFQFETIVGEKGWGAAIKRDDLLLESNRTRNRYYSRLELVIRPVSQYKVLDLAGKATIRNKEFFRRSHFEPLLEAESQKFADLIDAWVLEFAEAYVALS